MIEPRYKFCSGSSDEKDSRNLTEKIVDYTGYEEVREERKFFLKFIKENLPEIKNFLGNMEKLKNELNTWKKVEGEEDLPSGGVSD